MSRVPDLIPAILAIALLVIGSITLFLGWDAP